MTGAHASLPAATYAVVHALWQAALIAVATALALRALRRRSAALHHAVGLAALVAMVLAPVVTFALYRRGPSQLLAAADMTGPVLVRGAGWLAVSVPALWLAGVVAVATRQVIGWRAVVALGRCGAAPGDWALRIDQLRRRLGIARAIAVRALPAGAPFTAHARRPIVWLPPAWSALPIVQRDALAAHELAHVRRLDWIWNGVQHVLEAILWFHPAAWWLARRVRQDREHACDDLAVATCGDATALAEALLAVEHAAGQGARLALAARGGELIVRIRRLLVDAASPPRVPLALIGVLLLGAALASQLVLPRDMLLELRVDASTTGPLTPGTYRDITVDALRSTGHYRGSMDADGQLREVYEEDSEPRPIDPAVRAWLDELIAIDAR